MASYAGPVCATKYAETRPRLIRLLALVVCLLSAQASAQPQIPPKAHPDFTGVWAGPNGGGGGARTRPELLPQAAQLYARNKAGIMAGDPAVDPTLRCLPPGFPRGMIAALPAYFVQSKDVLAIVGEGGGRPRLIYIGGKHDPGFWDTFMGESVATWDGDVLVIDTVKIIEDAFLDADGLPHSDALHVVERFRLVDAKTMENQMTLDDPKFFVKPWVLTLKYQRRDDIRPVENVCEQNMRLRP